MAAFKFDVCPCPESRHSSRLRQCLSCATSRIHAVQQKEGAIRSPRRRRRAFETGLRRACFDLSDGGALGFTLRSGARVQLDLILLPHDSREMDRSANRFHRSGCRLYSAHMKEAGDAPASSLVILLRIRTGSCLLPCDGRQASSAGLVPSELLTFVVVVIVVLSFVVVVSVTDLMLIDSNASVAGAAYTGTHGRRVAAGADHRDGRHLADEDSIALGVGRHRMRVR